MLADVQYPTGWLPVGLIAAVVIGAAVRPALDPFGSSPRWHWLRSWSSVHGPTTGPRR